MPLILIEGLPGTGKTSLAKALHGKLLEKQRCEWWLEESKDHPVHPNCVKQHKYDYSFPDLCLEKWAALVSRDSRVRKTTILEGSFFQNTVRFLMQGNQWQRVEDYIQECENLLSQLNPMLIYLVPSNVLSHIQWVCEHRGTEWTSSVSSNLEQTPYCIERGIKGASVMPEFWSAYHVMCSDLFENSELRKLKIGAGCGDFEAVNNLVVNM